MTQFIQTKEYPPSFNKNNERFSEFISKKGDPKKQVIQGYTQAPKTVEEGVTRHAVTYGETPATVGTRVFVNASTILLIMVVVAAFVLVLITYLKLTSDESQILNIQNNVASIYMNLFSTSPPHKRNLQLETL